MWKIIQTLLLACCLQAAAAQDYQRSIWEDPIRFSTKGTKDDCYMSVTGQGDLTNLRILCRGPAPRSYWCEYKGKPHVCRNYNNNPRHYYKQIMWDLRKLQNACQGQSVIKPLMCRRASDEAQMVFASSSSPDATPQDRPSRPTFARPDQRQTQLHAFRSQSVRTSQGKTNQPKAFKSTTQRKTMTPKPTAPKPTDPVPTSDAKRLAQYYCWRSFQGVCSYFIGWFKN